MNYPYRITLTSYDALKNRAIHELPQRVHGAIRELPLRGFAMIMINTFLASDYPPLIIKPKTESEFIDISARISKTKTLDGGVVAEYRGLCHGDRMFSIVADLTEAETAALIGMGENYSEHICCCDEGVFLGFLDGISGDGPEKHIRFSVVRKLSAENLASAPMIGLYYNQSAFVQALLTEPFDVGTVTVGGSVGRGLYIKNIGANTLYLTGTPIVEENVPSADFRVDTELMGTLTTIPAGEHTSFILYFEPTSAGAKTVTIRIESNVGVLTQIFTGTGG